MKGYCSCDFVFGPIRHVMKCYVDLFIAVGSNYHMVKLYGSTI